MDGVRGVFPSDTAPLDDLLKSRTDDVEYCARNGEDGSVAVDREGVAREGLDTGPQVPEYTRE